MSEQDDKKPSLEDIEKTIKETFSKSTSNAIEQHNIVFRQMASQLILVGGIFLALSTQFSSRLSDAGIAIKVLSLITIFLINLSILFGILQHLMEAMFFRKIALGTQKIRKKYNDRKSSPANALGSIHALDQFGKDVGDSTRRWPTYVQMSLLATSVILIALISSMQLFASN